MVELLAVAPGYPLYGRVILEGGRAYTHDLLRQRGMLVRPELLAQLGLRVGERLTIGKETFTIRGVLAREPGRGLGMFSLGPRVFIDLADLPATGLVTFGSRVRHQLLLRMPETRIAPFVSGLRERFRNRFVSVRSYRDMEERVGRELETSENYLGLVGYAIVVLGGIGVWSVTRVFVQQKIRTIAILKCVGGTAGRILAVYVAQVLLLGARRQPAWPGAGADRARLRARRRLRIVRIGDLRPHRVGVGAGGGDRPSRLAALRARSAARGPARQAVVAVAGGDLGPAVRRRRPARAREGVARTGGLAACRRRRSGQRRAGAPRELAGRIVAHRLHRLGGIRGRDADALRDRRGAGARRPAAAPRAMVPAAPRRPRLRPPRPSDARDPRGRRAGHLLHPRRAAARAEPRERVLARAQAGRAGHVHHGRAAGSARRARGVSRRRGQRPGAATPARAPRARRRRRRPRRQSRIGRGRARARSDVARVHRDLARSPGSERDDRRRQALERACGAWRRARGVDRARAARARRTAGRRPHALRHRWAASSPHA